MSRYFAAMLVAGICVNAYGEVSTCAAEAPEPAPLQVYFVGPDGMQVNWELNKDAAFDSEPLIVPGRQNFPEGATYRLKLSKIPDHPRFALYPTIDIAARGPRTAAFLAHNPIPVQFTVEDLAMAARGDAVTKAIYVPDPELQEVAVTGLQSLVSTRLDPGVDPVVEADRRGAIVAVVRIPAEVPEGQAKEEPSLVVGLAKALNDKNALVAKHAAIALGEAGDIAAIPALRAALVHKEQKVRDAAADALERLVAAGTNPGAATKMSVAEAVCTLPAWGGPSDSLLPGFDDDAACPLPCPAPAHSTFSIREPEGMYVTYPTDAAGKVCETRETPCEIKLRQGAVHEVRLSNIWNFPELNVMANVEVVAAEPGKENLPADMAIPLSFGFAEACRLCEGVPVTQVVFRSAGEWQEVVIFPDFDRTKDALSELIGGKPIFAIVRLKSDKAPRQAKAK